MPVYILRGVGYVESSLAANPAVSVYVDEVPLPYPAMTRGALLDLQRVEVLMGPQGTLFGQNSTGGGDDGDLIGEHVHFQFLLVSDVERRCPAEPPAALRFLRFNLSR